MWFSTCRVYTLVSLVALVLASSGDRDSDFQSCISRCAVERCHFATPLPLALLLTRWTCQDDCKYDCMHMLTDHAVQTRGAIRQYYGKWPFWRLWGMQEPASVMFSLWNLWSHLQGARRIRRQIPSAHPMRSYYLTCAYISINAWIWSAVFHTRGVSEEDPLHCLFSF